MHVEKQKKFVSNGNRNKISCDVFFCPAYYARQLADLKQHFVSCITSLFILGLFLASIKLDFNKVLKIETDNQNS